MDWLEDILTMRETHRVAMECDVIQKEMIMALQDALKSLEANVTLALAAKDELIKAAHDALAPAEAAAAAAQAELADAEQRVDALAEKYAPPSPELAISGTPETTLAIGTAYAFTPTVDGGTAPYTFAATGLPADLAIDASTGAITGTPTAAETATIEVTVTDSSTPPQTATLPAFGVTIA